MVSPKLLPVRVNNGGKVRKRCCIPGTACGGFDYDTYYIDDGQRRM